MRRAGFTLAEVVVVLVVIGIVSAAVAPVLVKGGRPHPVTAAASQASDVLSGARREAVRRGVAVVLEFDTRTGGYRADHELAAAGAVEAAGGGTLQLPAGVSFAGAPGRRRYRFDPVGAGHGPDLEIRGAGRIAVITLDPWTGAPRAAIR